MRCDSGVAGEGRVVGVPTFHSWGKCSMPLMNINLDGMSNASSGQCIECTTMLPANIIHVMCGYKADEGELSSSQLIN